eukprot:CAMPEP_0115121618 /NCGR_PEP_ID=MMETSP0227-20121206/46347_1 /TAXON_ID=89957 /ORGANISM="Polarella glacialis, Strain CCMP 1383" /LENGTH=113 /DNA_ID=CAMNT_0002523419 /DNA_START=15 /DNA_END=352 /DNA_ORIENTATION=+
MATEDKDEEFYVRYYVGHKGKFGHEFLEFEFRPDGRLRYANNSNYKNDVMIRKEVHLTPAVMRELIGEKWLHTPRVQELIDIMQINTSWRINAVSDGGKEHISFTTSKIGSLA